MAERPPLSLIGVWWCDHHDHIYISGTEGCDATRLTCVHGVTERFECNDCSAPLSARNEAL